MAVIFSIIGTIVLGTTVATATIVGVVSSQTAEPTKSPVSVSAPQDQQIQYGS